MSVLLGETEHTAGLLANPSALGDRDTLCPETAGQGTCVCPCVMPMTPGQIPLPTSGQADVTTAYGTPVPLSARGHQWGHTALRNVLGGSLEV